MLSNGTSPKPLLMWSPCNPHPCGVSSSSLFTSAQRLKHLKTICLFPYKWPRSPIPAFGGRCPPITRWPQMQMNSRSSLPFECKYLIWPRTTRANANVALTPFHDTNFVDVATPRLPSLRRFIRAESSRVEMHGIRLSIRNETIGKFL